VKYKNLDEIKYENMKDLEYVAALTGRVPYYDATSKRALLLTREEAQEYATKLAKEGKFAEAKDLLGAMKRDYLKELEGELALRTFSVRIPFPLWVKLYALALKHETSPSAVLKRLLAKALRELIEELHSRGIIEDEPYIMLRDVISNIESIQERRTFRVDELGRKYVLIYEHEKPIRVEDIPYLHAFLKMLVKVHAGKVGVPGEIVDLLFEKAVTSNFETPEAFFFTYVGLFKVKDDVFLRIGAEVNTLDFRHVVFDYPIKAIQEFPPEIVLKFHELIMFDAFLDCPEVIDVIKEKLEKKEAITLADYKAIFCHKFDEEIEALYKEGAKSMSTAFLPYCFEDYPLPLFTPRFAKDELIISGITLKRRAKTQEAVRALREKFKRAYYDALGLSDQKIREAEESIKRGKIDEEALEILSTARGIDLFLDYMLEDHERRDILSAFSKPSEVFTVKFPKPLARILELFTGKKLNELIKELL